MTWWQAVICVWAALIGLVIYLGYRRARRREREYVTAAYVARHGWRPWHWSQDGWVRRCKICGAIQYGGDKHIPDTSGLIEQ